MLTRLSIANLATIESLTLELGPGFTVFTGETGAGKSILIDAIRLALGAKAAPALLRTGATHTIVEAEFDLKKLPAVRRRLDELGVPSTGGLVLRRVLQDNGRNRVLANDCLISVTNLNGLAEHLVDIHGQHDNQILLQTQSHVQFLDTFGNLLSLRGEVAALHGQYTGLARKRRELNEKAAARRKRREELIASITKIEAATITPGEDQAVHSELAVLNHVEQLIETAEAVRESMNEGEGAVLTRLGEIEQWLTRAAKLDPEITVMKEQVAPLRFQAEDLYRAVESYRAKLEPDPNRVETLNERLAVIEKIKRRYGPGIEDVLNFLETSREDLAKLEEADESLDSLGRELESVAGSLHRSVQQLSAQRRKAATRLDREILGQLNELGMDRAAFETSIQPIRSATGKTPAYTAMGGDDVEFLLSSNPGQAVRPLANIASGGELSRIMLALKSVLTKSDPTGTLIFDEVDQGISGGAAEVVGSKLRALGDSHQVLCVTHLPQIAALGDHHMLVTKEMDRQQTYTRAKPLDTESKVREVARLLSGIEVSGHSLRSAEEMVERGR